MEPVVRDDDILTVQLYIKCVLRHREFYRLGIERTKPAAVRKWEGEGFSPKDWSDIFTVPYTCTKSTKLQSFQYQIIHRFTPTRRFLCIRKIVDSPACLRCKGVDTIIHHFYDCPKVAKFWSDVAKYIREHGYASCQLDRFEVLFGIPNAPAVINLLITSERAQRASEFILN